MGSTSCTVCAMGSYSAYPASSACEACNEGYYQPKRGQGSCLNCAAVIGNAYHSPAGDSNCSTCIAGYYMSKGVCYACPEGTDCKVGSTLEDMELKSGYYRFFETSTEVSACPRSKDCLGGNISGLASCSARSRGPLCSRCQPNSYVREGLDACTSCKGSKDLWWLPPLVIAVLLFSCVGFFCFKREAIQDYLVRHENRWSLDSNDITARCNAVFVATQTIVLIQANHTYVGGEDTPQPYKAVIRAVSFFR